jgi:outer membrane protein assembly factor BamB
VHTPGYTSITIEFYFYAVSMETGEDFWVQYYNGSTWSTVSSFVSGTSFSNNTFYSAKVTVSESLYTFPTSMKIRFMCDASDNNDDVYIDNIKISASTGTSRNAGDVVINEMATSRTSIEDEINDGLLVYPNPANDVLNIELGIEENSTLRIFNVTGQLLRTEVLSSDKTQITIDDLKPGLYLIQINNGDEVYSSKLLKK